MELNLVDLAGEEKRILKELDENPEDSSVLFTLGLIYQKQNKIDLATYAYEKAIQLDQNPHYYYKYGEMLFDHKQFSKSLDNLLKALELTDSSWELYSELEALIDQLYQNDSCSW